MTRIMSALRARFRHRHQALIRSFLSPDCASGPLLDLGCGSAGVLAAALDNPAHLVQVDVQPIRAIQAKRAWPESSAVVADGTRLPLADRSMATLVCHSVVEHVDDQAGLAREIRRVARSYLVQTPSADFPLELHSSVPIPFYRRIPTERVKRAVCRLFGAHYGYVSGVRYVSEPELRRLFPEASIVHEKVAGLTKSFYVLYK